MTGLHCDISAEVNGAALRIKAHFVAIMQKSAPAARGVAVDVCEIEDILKDALPLQELFALREAVRASCGAEDCRLQIQELKWAAEEQAAKVAELEDR